MTSSKKPSECHVAVLTPPGRGAIASLVVFGESAVDTVEALFETATKQSLRRRANRIIYGRWRARGPVAGEDAGEELVVVCRDQHTVEVHCHGGSAAVERIVGSLTTAGSIEVSADVWLAHQTPDRLAAEAWLAIAQARTNRVASILMDQLHGTLSQAIRHALERLTCDDVEPAIRSVSELLGRAPLGRHLTTPWRIALVGPTNVGKSSLINSILGYQRALVCPAAGTTRDVLTDVTAIDGWPVEFADTAGLRNTESDVERQGMRLAEHQAATADLVLLVTDLTQPWSNEHRRWLDRLERTHLLIHNKHDLVSSPPDDRPPGILTSARESTGIDALTEAIIHHLVPQTPPPGTAIPFLDRHTRLLQGALEALRDGEYLTARERLKAMLAWKSDGGEYDAASLR